MVIRKQEQLRQLKASEKSFEDLSLKDGEVLHINLKTPVATSTPIPATTGDFSIAPPPQSKFHRKINKAAPPTPAPSLDYPPGTSPSEQKAHIFSAPTPKNSIDVSVFTPTSNSNMLSNSGLFAALEKVQASPSNSSWNPFSDDPEHSPAPSPASTPSSNENPFLEIPVNAASTSNSNWVKF